MSSVYVVYWSGTGNTEAMAHAVAEGVTAAGGEAKLCQVDEVRAADLADAKAIALGCPSMGAEQLEEGSMEPFMGELDGMISGKVIGLFGSYGWGDGEWMRNWEERVEGDGARVLDGEGIITNGEPSQDILDECQKMGKSLAAI